MDKFEGALLSCLLTPLGNPNDIMCNWGITPNFIGGSGIGKSARITTISKAAGLNVYPIFSATKTPEHIGGFPANTPEGFMLKCALPQVINAIDDQRAVIFLDEISTAPPAVQAALLSFVNERTIGEYVLPTGVRIVMAMNPADMAANGHDMEIPMANRVAHFNYAPPSVEQWAEFILGRYSPGIPRLLDGENQVKSRWNDHFPQVAAIAGDFMRANNGQYSVKNSEGVEETRSKLYDQPDSSDPRANGPWPSHRSWFQAVHGVATVRCLGFDPTLETDIVAALVGTGLAVEWATYVRKVDLPQPIDVLTKDWDMPKRIDIVRIVLNSCSSYVANMTDKKNKISLAPSCWKLLGKAVTKGYADIAIKPAGTLIRAGLDISHPDVAIQEAAEDVCALPGVRDQLKYLK